MDEIAVQIEKGIDDEKRRYVETEIQMDKYRGRYEEIDTQIDILIKRQTDKKIDRLIENKGECRKM